jgi:hypothetical protein
MVQYPTATLFPSFLNRQEAFPANFLLTSIIDVVIYVGYSAIPNNFSKKYFRKASLDNCILSGPGGLCCNPGTPDNNERGDRKTNRKSKKSQNVNEEGMP